MNFKVLSFQEVISKCIDMLENEKIESKDFNGMTKSSKHVESDYQALIELLQSNDSRYQMTGINLFLQHFFGIFGPNQHIEANKIISISHSATKAKQSNPENMEIFDVVYTTTDEMEDGTLFEWCGEPMFIVGRNTYTILNTPHYNGFEFFEGEPAYVFGKVSQSLVDHIKENFQE